MAKILSLALVFGMIAAVGCGGTATTSSKKVETTTKTETKP
jgi:hypothetical protein